MSNLYDNRSKKAEHGGLFAVPAVAAGQEIEMEKTVNAPYEALKVYGKSEQKAKWNQAEGITSQVQEDGYNLLNCNVEWEPSAENQGISNIQSSVGSISFDYLHDHINYPYIRTKGTIHLKPGIYTISGIASGDPLDSVGFSQGAPDGYSQVVGDCNGIISIETEGDYHFYVYPMGEDRLASYELTNLMVTEGSISKTYQEYGYSKPSPAYPSELISHISAGSYQITTENGIYEVTLTEDLRGLDDTYRDFIRFDSVSGTGYLSKRIIETVFDGENQIVSDIEGRNQTKHRKLYSFMNITSLKGVDKVLCDRFPYIAEEGYADKTGVFMQKLHNAFSFNMPLELIGATTSDTDQSILSKANNWMKENPCTVQYIAAELVKEPLTFTKVESSTLPVLPWTAYGKNLIPFEPFEIPEGLAGSRNYPAPPLIVGETYYPSGKLSDGSALNSENCAFILLKNGVQLWNKSPRSITITEELAETDTVSVYVNKKEGGKTVAEFQFELGSAKTDYEPFNSTPPESLTPSPDYPQQIYDLKDVTVTSRGRNLATAQQVYSGANAYLETTLDGRECVRFQDNISMKYEKLSFKENVQYTVSFEAKCVQQASASGESLIFRFFYTDGTNSSITESSNTDWKGYVLTSTAGKTVSYIGLSSYNYVNYNYIDVNTFQLEEGTERTPPYDKYRCTSATIPLTLRSCGDDKDFVVSGTDIKQAKAVGNKQFVGTENIAWMTGIRDDGSIIFSVIVSDINPAAELLCNHFLQGEDASGNINRIFTIGSYQAVYFCMYANELGLTASDDESTKKTKIKAWFAKQNEIGFPVTVQYVLNTPIETEITDTWAQDMIGLKTAPYWTKIYTDKETGGLKAQYLSMKWNDNETGIDYLLTSDGEKVVTNDKKTVILF